MASSNSQIDKSQRGHPKRAEQPIVNINTGVQSFNTERTSVVVTKPKATFRTIHPLAELGVEIHKTQAVMS